MRFRPIAASSMVDRLIPCSSSAGTGVRPRRCARINVEAYVAGARHRADARSRSNARSPGVSRTYRRAGRAARAAVATAPASASASAGAAASTCVSITRLISADSVSCCRSAAARSAAFVAGATRHWMNASVAIATDRVTTAAERLSRVIRQFVPILSSSSPHRSTRDRLPAPLQPSHRRLIQRARCRRPRTAAVTQALADLDSG